MRFSIWPGAQQSYAEILEIARHAERTGWDGVYVADHFMANAGGPTPPETPTHECGTLVGALGAAVPRVRIGSLVYGNTYRHPAVLANMAVTADHVSGGRFTLGVGAGWQVNEHRQYGIELPKARELLDRFEESLQIIRSLLTSPTTTFHGTYYQLTDALCEPKPVQAKLPLLVGGSGEKRMLRLVAQHADIWNTWGLPDLIAHKAAVLDEHCRSVGRDPAAIERTAQALVLFEGDADAVKHRAGSTTQPLIAGTPEEVAEVIRAYEAIGLAEFIVPDRLLGKGTERLKAMDTFIERVTGAA
jgi:F420-dependent oxidoreductase-like protein